jgi:hypothetical protein
MMLTVKSRFIEMIIILSALNGIAGSTDDKRRYAMKNCLQSYIEKRVAASDLAIRYHVGNSFSGETELRLGGDGKYELWSTVTKGRQRKTYSGQLEVEQVEQVAKELLENEIWEIKHFPDGPVPDDPEASIEIECAGQKFKAALWVSEIRKSPRFAKAQQALLTLVHTLSDGEILESGN